MVLLTNSSAMVRWVRGEAKIGEATEAQGLASLVYLPRPMRDSMSMDRRQLKANTGGCPLTTTYLHTHMSEYTHTHKCQNVCGLSPSRC